MFSSQRQETFYACTSYAFPILVTFVSKSQSVDLNLGSRFRVIDTLEPIQWIEEVWNQRYVEFMFIITDEVSQRYL